MFNKIYEVRYIEIIKQHKRNCVISRNRFEQFTENLGDKDFCVFVLRKPG